MKLIIFDAYNTLLEVPQNKPYQFLIRRVLENKSPDEQGQLANNLRYRVKTESLDWATHFNLNAKDKETFNVLLDLETSLIKPFVDVPQSLAKLNLPYCILSNLAKGYELPIKKYFTVPSYFSFELGMVKPNIALFKLVAQKHNLAPKDILLIDDKISNLTAAQSIGMQVILIQREKASLATPSNILTIKDLSELEVALTHI